MKYILVQWPESQYLMEHKRFHECLFVQDIDGHDEVGSSAYMVPEDLYTEIFSNKLIDTSKSSDHSPILIEFLLSGRLLKGIYTLCAEYGVEPTTLTARQFANKWSRRDFLKVRGCGKKTLFELYDIFDDLNIKW